ncbi:MAG: hypothetical protein J5449_08720, partial [Oscillospiraceae bacterium]|nr:hypothetical protein [Oscillospiraceae bacterium]
MQDTEIIELYWARSERAIPATSERYGSYCTGIAWNILHSREDTEECVNDTWLHAWNAMPPHRPSILRTFLGKLTRNLAIDRYQLYTAEKQYHREQRRIAVDGIAEDQRADNGVYSVEHGKYAEYDPETEGDREGLARKCEDAFEAVTDEACGGPFGVARAPFCVLVGHPFCVVTDPVEDTLCEAVILVHREHGVHHLPRHHAEIGGA